MTNIEIVRRYLESLDAGDFDAAAVLLSANADVVTPDGTRSGSEFLAGLRGWSGLDNLNIAIRDRVLSEELGVVVSHATRVFTWKESGEVAYEQPAKAHFPVDAGRIVKVELQ